MENKDIAGSLAKTGCSMMILPWILLIVVILIAFIISLISN